MGIRRHRATTAAVAVGALLVAGCSQTGPVQPYAEDATVACAGKQTLTASGSTAQASAMAHFAKAYQAACPETALSYTANGSAQGIAEFLGGKTDFANSDSPLQGAEYDRATQRCGGSEALNIPIVFGPIAITYNLPDVDVLILDGPTLAGIFSGKITRWDDPAIEALNLPSGRAHPNPRTAMPAQEIRVIHRSDGSGTTDNFQQYLQAASDGVWSRGAGKTFNGGTGQGAEGNQGTADMVKNTPGSISYNEWSFAIDRGLSTADIQTPAGVTHIGTDWVGTSIAPVSIVGEGNNLVLDLTPAYQPAAKFGYPIILAGYAIVCSRYADQPTGDAVKSFLQSAVTVGQTDLNKVGYIPLPPDFQSKAAAAIGSLIAGVQN
jgi:phosphate transport system substrate-binding protein